MKEQEKNQIDDGCNLVKMLKKVLIGLLIVLIIFYILCVMNIPTIFLKISFVIICIYLLISIYDIGIKNIFSCKVITQFDRTMIYLYFLISSIILTFQIMEIFKICSFYQICIITVPVFIYCYIMFRIWYLEKRHDYKKRENSVYDLNTLYKNEIPNKNEKDKNILLLKETPADNDLLKRGKFIERLKETIMFCKTDEKYVIALKGKWGSGKTTVLNCVKKELNKNDEYIIVDEFSPWEYDDKQSLIEGMYTEIVKKIGNPLICTNINKVVRSYLSILFEQIGVGKLFDISHENAEDIIEQNKRMLNSYLKVYNKTLVIIIDDVERIPKDNIKFFFMLINKFFNFNNIIYVLVFDNEILKKILEDDLNTDYRYIEKLIQLEIQMPIMSYVEKKKIIDNCIINWLKYYEIETNFYDYKIADLMNKNIIDLRMLIRYINALSFNVASVQGFLNIKQWMLLEIIKYSNLDLYNEIYNNRKYYIRNVKDIDVEMFLDAENKEEKYRKYFSVLLEKNKDYKSLLINIFPETSRYIDGGDFWVEKNNEEESIKMISIENEEYFYMYFELSENDIGLIHHLIKQYIKNIENGECVSENIKNLIRLYDDTKTNFVFQIFRTLIKESNEKYYYEIVKNMYEHIVEKDELLFLRANAQTIMIYTIVELLFKITMDEYAQFLSFGEKDYSRIFIIHKILSGMKKLSNNSEKELEQIKLLEEKANGIVQKIIKNNINVLSKEYYIHKNIWGIYHSTKDNKEERIKYTESILNRDNILRFLNDVMKQALGNGYEYSITKQYIEEFANYDFVANLVNEKRIDIHSQNEKEIIEIFDLNGQSKTYDEEQFFEV